MFKIITDSTADLPEGYIYEHNLGCMNLSYIVDGETYGQGKELPYKDFYAAMRHGKMPVTSQVNPEEARMHFLAALEECSEILCLAFSSGLSGTYNSMCVAAEELMQEYPGCRIIVIDTLCASLGEGLLVHKAVRLRDAGWTIDQVADWVQTHIQNFVHVFTVDDLFHLSRGGRIGKATAVMGSLVGIKPIMHVDNEGHLIALSKVRGRKKSLQSLVEYMGDHLGSYAGENDEIFISHGDDLEAAVYVKNLIKERFGIENYLINNVGPTIGAHAGPGVIALFFMGDIR